jgi:hypothetical protein
MALRILVLCFASKLRALVVLLVIISIIAYSLMMWLSIYIYILHPYIYIYIYRGAIATKPIFGPSGRIMVLDDSLRRPFIIFLIANL